jgi:hypothetical protein
MRAAWKRRQITNVWQGLSARLHGLAGLAEESAPAETTALTMASNSG